MDPGADDQDTLTVGALAVAPSNDSVIYAGTGEGALSGDSMFGDGILKSTNGGANWTHVSGDYFVGVSVSRLVVDPANPNHLYAAILRGRGGARRVSPPVHSRFGIWESTDGGVTWSLLKEVPEANGATDLEMDPLNPSILYASFWGDAIYKSTDGGHTWAPIMNGLPAGRLRGRGDALLDRDLASVGSVTGGSVRRVRLEYRDGTPCRRRSSSRRTPARAGPRPVPGRTTRTTSRTTAARSASTTT